MRRIAILTGSRADASPLEPLIQELSYRQDCDLWVVVTQGLYGNEAAVLSRLKEISPHILVALGDRTETALACVVAASMGIPIAHLSGGDETLGAVDNALRHAITKLAYWHFPICGLHAERIIQMGESPDRVFNYGALAVDNLTNLMEKQEVEKELGIKFKGKVAALCLHPETLSEISIDDQFARLIQCPQLAQSDTIIVSGCNDDAGGAEMQHKLNLWFGNGISRGVCGRQTYGPRLWNSIMNEADYLIGNSSSFIIEGMTLGKTVINIGDRQKGRYEEAKMLFAEDKYAFGIPGAVAATIADKLMSVEIPARPIKEFYVIP